MLRDITIENYRLFEEFHLEGMTRVNLLVGMNNSGKSSLLEAIYLLMNSENSVALSEVLSKRFIASSRVRSRSEIETTAKEEGTVFRLERKNGEIDYVAYTGEELAVAVDHDIEVR